jgi:hypothetical protein
MGMFIMSSYLKDLSDADLMIRPGGPNANHLAWQLGHLIQSEHEMMNAVCPNAMPALPAGFAAAHGRDMTKDDDTSKFLKKEEYLNLLSQQRDATLKALRDLPDAGLDQPAPERMRSYAPTVGAVFRLCGEHLTMHCGQFAVVRRMLGKPVVI